MKKNRFKRVLSIALTAVMVAGTITFMPGGVTEVHAETTPKNINLGTGGIGNPTSTGSDAAAWAGSKVYYAGKECYVLDKDGALTGGNSSVSGCMLLLTKNVLSTQQKFDDDKSDWSTSIIRENLNDIGKTEDSGGFLGTMTSLEQDSIDATTINSSNTKNWGYDSFPSTETKDKIFLLDFSDANNANYGFASDATKTVGCWWWLRSPCEDDELASYADYYGYAHTFGHNVFDGGGYVRPAFNLNLTSVLFTSASGTSKSSFSQVNNTGADTWKLTLKDESKEVSVTSGQSVTKSGQVVTVPYTYTGSDVSQISIMITDKDRTASDASILYYGALDTTLATAGTGTFTLPEGLPEGYKIYMMAEDVNGDTLTDYSSVPVELPEPVSIYDVTITPGSNMTKTTTSGEASQTGISGAMTDVVYTANDGFYFPTSYSVTAVNGVGVTRNSYKQITVSGTPTANADITLITATEKASQSAPTVTDGVDKIVGTTTAMEYASSATATTWKPCTDKSTTVAAGTWYVRYKATDTQKAGEPTTVAVTTEALSKPTITAGADSKHQIGTTGTITISCSGAMEDLKEIQVDGEVVGTDNYTIKKGSTILTFKTSYLDTLSAGKHTVKFVYNDGQTAETNFEITRNDAGITTDLTSPKTGDYSPIMPLIILLFVFGLGILAVQISRKRRKQMR